MPDGVKELPVEIRDEMEALISMLLGRGWSLVSIFYDAKCFGNWHIDLRNGGSTLRLVKDRSQYMIDGSELDELKAAGLFQAFDGLKEFRTAIINWLASADQTRSSIRG
jgi:hypothetical protein